MQLVDPHLDHEDSYIELIADFTAHQERPTPFTLQEDHQDFPALITRLKNYAKGNVPQGFVQHQTFWLIDERNTVIGASNLRLTLTDKLRQRGGHIGFGIKPSERRKGYATLLLAETLIKAQARNLTSLLITCDKDNIGSAKAIQRNGGILEFEGKVPPFEAIVQRYWIHL